MATGSRATAWPREKENHRSTEQDTALSRLSAGCESRVKGLAVPNTGQGNGRVQQRHKDQFKPAPAISEKVLSLLKLHCLANRRPRLVGPRLCCETLIKRECSGIENKAAPKRLEGSGPGPAPHGRTRMPLASLWNVTNGDDTESMTQKLSCCWPITTWRAAESLGLLIIV